MHFTLLYLDHDGGNSESDNNDKMQENWTVKGPKNLSDLEVSSSQTYIVPAEDAPFSFEKSNSNLHSTF